MVGVDDEEAGAERGELPSVVEGAERGSTNLVGVDEEAVENGSRSLTGLGVAGVERGSTYLVGVDEAGAESGQSLGVADIEQMGHLSVGETWAETGLLSPSLGVVCVAVERGSSSLVGLGNLGEWRAHLGVVGKFRGVGERGVGNRGIARLLGRKRLDSVWDTGVEGVESDASLAVDGSTNESDEKTNVGDRRDTSEEPCSTGAFMKLTRETVDSVELDKVSLIVSSEGVHSNESVKFESVKLGKLASVCRSDNDGAEREMSDSEVYGCEGENRDMTGSCRHNGAATLLRR